MIPIADHPRDPAHRPWATLALLGANALVGVVTLPLGWLAWSPEPLPPGIPAEAAPWLTRLDQLTLAVGFRPADPSVWTAFAAMFLHGSVLHLVGNALYLWIYGPNVERRLGRAPFLLLYATAGLLGAMLYTLVSLGSEIPMIGASGAISGLLGAYLVLFPTHTIRLWFWVTTIRLPAFLVLLSFVVVDNLVPFALGAATGVAHAAHLGGFFGGVALAAGLRVVDPERAPRRPRADPLAAALRLERQGLVVDAHRALVDLARAADPEVAASARDHAAWIEADPTFQRARSRST
jgi:membrane associated rhomboid family serine protease